MSLTDALLYTAIAPQSRPAKPPSKTALLKVARQERREAREAKRASDAARLESARAIAATLGKRMPADYQEWGVIRTRAYVQLLEIIQSKAENVTMMPDRLESYLQTLGNASQWTLEYCQHLSMLHARAATIEVEA